MVSREDKASHQEAHDRYERSQPTIILLGRYDAHANVDGVSCCMLAFSKEAVAGRVSPVCIEAKDPQVATLELSSNPVII